MGWTSLLLNRWRVERRVRVGASTNKWFMMGCGMGKWGWIGFGIWAQDDVGGWHGVTVGLCEVTVGSGGVEVPESSVRHGIKLH